MMKSKLKIFLLLTVVWQCNGHLRLLGDILASAHDRIHSKVENVAGALLGGISHLGGHRHPDNQGGYNPNTTPGDTVVVVIKEEDNHNDYGPPDQNFQRPSRPPFNNDDHHIQHNQRPNHNIPNREDNYGNGQHNRPNYGNNYPDNQYQGNGNVNKYPNNQHHGNNQHGQPDNGYPQHDNNYYNQDNHFNRPNNNNNNDYRPPDNGYPQQDNNYNQNNNLNRPNSNNNDNRPSDNGHPQQGNQNNRPNNNNNGYRPDNFGHDQVSPTVPFDKNTQNTEKSSTEYATKKPDYKPKEEEKTTKPVDDDAPFFIPLNPNEYTYGGDKINVTAPKRDTNNNAEPEDEDFNIDIRIKDT